MCTDIFARRYKNAPIWKQFTTNENRLIVQTFRLVSEQILFPYYVDGKENAAGKANQRLSCLSLGNVPRCFV